MENSPKEILQCDFQAFRKLLTNVIISKVLKRKSYHEKFLAKNSSGSTLPFAGITLRAAFSIHLFFLLSTTIINTESIFVQVFFGFFFCNKTRYCVIT